MQTDTLGGKSSNFIYKLKGFESAVSTQQGNLGMVVNNEMLAQNAMADCVSFANWWQHSPAS